MNYHGHDELRASLKRSGLPQVSMFAGPWSVGKHTLARSELRRAGINAAETLDTKERLSVEVACQTKQFLQTRPLGTRKGCIVHTDSANEQALNTLLKILEEPPKYATIIIVTSKPTLLTIASRAEKIQFGFLTTEEVASVLRDKFGLSNELATRAAKASRGQIKRAIEMTDIDSLKAPVVSLAKAMSDGDEELLARIASTWTQQNTRMLKTLLHEILFTEPNVFSSTERFNLRRNTPGLAKAYKALGSKARPRIAVKVAAGHVMR